METQNEQLKKLSEINDKLKLKLEEIKNKADGMLFITKSNIFDSGDQKIVVIKVLTEILDLIDED